MSLPWNHSREFEQGHAGLNGNHMKATRPRLAEEDQYIFTEGIDYSKTGKTSIWGMGDKETLKLLETIEFHGKWLYLAAGDGRYNINLLEKADLVVASDIDESALGKLWETTPDIFKTKLNIEVFDLTKKFPFESASFDGMFCTGALHHFPEEMLRQIFFEIDRILKPSGKIIIDFATDIQRTLTDGTLYIRKHEPIYTIERATTLLNELLKNYTVQSV